MNKREHRLTLLAAFLICSILAACTPSITLAAPAGDLIVDGTSRRADGSSIHWRLKKTAGSDPHGILFTAQGSGCQSVLANPNMQAAANMAGGLAVLTIEKYGVEPNDSPEDPSGDCAPAYFAHNTISQRVADATQVLAELKQGGTRNGTLVLWGGSSGGAVVAILAAQEPDTDAVVVFSSGTGLTLAESLPLVLPPPALREAEAMIAAARSNPESTEVRSGNSLKWWADIMDRRLSDDLLKASAPILLVQGVRDQFAPVAAARATADAFRAAGNTRLTYWELPDRDHRMIDGAGNSHLAEELARIGVWIEGVLKR